MLTVDEMNQQLSQSDTQLGWPIVESVSASGRIITLQLRVARALAAFRGHFPEQPVLPGILQIHWAAELAVLAFNTSGLDLRAANFSAMRGLKFNSMVLPAATLTLTLEWRDGRLKFSYTSDETRHSNGTLVFDEVA